MIDNNNTENKENQLIVTTAPQKGIILEVCAGDLRSVLAAHEGGAYRVELCSGLAEGGMTPSFGLIREAVKTKTVKVNVLIRPRPGDFVYGPAEAEAMITDISMAIEAGADGVVIGALTPDGNIDLPLVKKMIQAAGNADVTFHRAFDMCRDPFEALEQLIDLGVRRILTSGQAPSALQGTDLLAALVEKAAGRLSIMPGGGVNPDNAAKIIQATHAREIHASAREAIPSSMKFRRQEVSMGKPGTDEFACLSSSSAIVNRIVKAINL